MKSLVKIVLAGLAVVLCALAAFAFAREISVTSADKDNLLFTFDIQPSYSLGQPMPASVGVIDVSTNRKPSDTTVLMKINNRAETVALSRSTTQSTRIIDLSSYGLSPGTHSITFRIPEKCGSFFDFSRFVSGTRFDNLTDCQYRYTVDIQQGDDVITVCSDPSANNTGAQGVCTYDDPNATCSDPSANNTGQLLPCTYDVCTDRTANNFGARGDCNYDAVCTDSSAVNFGFALPCDYDGDVCLDDAANNTGEALPCAYDFCLDSDAENEGERGICIYFCKDLAANNTGQPLPCDYDNNICLDDRANNTDEAGDCEYDYCLDRLADNDGELGDCDYTCKDLAANNTGQPIPCKYDTNVCSDDNADNFNQEGECQYVCEDPVASNLGDPLPCEYVNFCLDPGADNHLAEGDCIYPEYCLDRDALNFEERGRCIYGPNIEFSDFECSTNNRNWQPCQGRVFTLTTENDPIFIQTENIVSAWSSFCRGGTGNGAVVERIDPLQFDQTNIRLNFDFTEQAPANLYDMEMCLDATNAINSIQNFQIKLLEFEFIEN